MADSCFLSHITLHAVGPVQNCAIALSKKERQHLILTGRNGSGKTAVLETVCEVLLAEAECAPAAPPLTLTFAPPERWQALRRTNACLLAYYPASFGHGQPEPAQQLDAWLPTLNQALQELFQDPTLTLQCQPSPWRVTLCSRQSATGDPARLSEGQQRILSIFCDLLMRMEGPKTANQEYDVPGIVLIDGLEHSLHIEAQKRVLPVLTTTFPNLQFLVSTHSPFVMNSLESAVVFDLDHHARVKDVLTYPYEALIERYDLRKYSDQVRQLLGEYESLLNKKLKTEQEEFRLLELGNYLAWVLTKFRKNTIKSTIEN